MKLYTFLAFALLVFAFSPVFAKPHDKGDHNHGTVGITISLGDRNIIQDYLRQEYQPKHCPPGLAKKHNGCLPPGIAKKYAMGQPLPPGIAKKRLPSDLLDQLHPLDGYQYVQVDQDVLLISEATKKVIDAVTLLSAVH